MMEFYHLLTVVVVNDLVGADVIKEDFMTFGGGDVNGRVCWQTKIAGAPNPSGPYNTYEFTFGSRNSADCVNRVQFTPTVHVNNNQQPGRSQIIWAPQNCFRDGDRIEFQASSSYPQG